MTSSLQVHFSLLLRGKEVRIAAAPGPGGPNGSGHDKHNKKCLREQSPWICPRKAQLINNLSEWVKQRLSLLQDGRGELRLLGVFGHSFPTCLVAMTSEA